MSIELNYPTKFHQTNLLRFACSNKKTTEKFTDQIISTGNINLSIEGICVGLSHTYIAYENKGLGLEFIKHLNNVLNLAKLDIPSDNPIINYNNMAYRELAFEATKKYYLDALKLQINETKAIYYHQMCANLKKKTLPPKLPNETNQEYINYCLDINRNEKKMIEYHYINADIEREIINQLYEKIEKNIDVKAPELRKSCATIYDKIRHKKNLTADDTKLFLLDAYHHCAAFHEFKTTLFNINSGLTYDNNKPYDAYENTVHKWKSITKFNLINSINIAKRQNKDFFAIYGTHNHAMAITAKYDTKQKKHKFSFFEPNKGIIETNDLNKIIEVINQIPTTISNNIIKFTNLTEQEQEKIQIIGEVQLFEQSTHNNNRLDLHTITQKSEHSATKKLLAKNKITISMRNNAKLTFEHYYPENDELTLKLKIGRKVYRLYSELNNVNITIDLINASMNEYQKYKSNDVYIDWRGQILNRLKTT